MGNSGIAFAGDSHHLVHGPAAKLIGINLLVLANIQRWRALISETSAGLLARTDAIVALKPRWRSFFTGVNDIL